MEGTSWSIIIAVIVVGALIQTLHLAPSVFDRAFDIAASKMMIAFALLGVSLVLVLLFLKGLNRWNREGFQTKTAIDSWKELVDTYQLRQVYEVKKRMEDRVFVSIKGSPPDQLSDTQARERTDKLFNKGSLNCTLFNKTLDAKDIDTFFVAIQELPNEFLIQAYETIEHIRNLLKEQVKNLRTQQSKMRNGVEGFIDPSVGICSAEIVQERRKFLRQKKLDEAAQRCLLPEEVPFESKDTIAQNIVTKISDTYLNYMRSPPGRPTFDNLLKESLSLEAELNKAQDDAQSGKLLGNV